MAKNQSNLNYRRAACELTCWPPVTFLFLLFYMRAACKITNGPPVTILDVSSTCGPHVLKQTGRM